MMLTILGLVIACCLFLAVLVWVAVSESRRLDREIRRQIPSEYPGTWVNSDCSDEFITGKPKRRRPYAEVQQ